MREFMKDRFASTAKSSYTTLIAPAVEWAAMTTWLEDFQLHVAYTLDEERDKANVGSNFGPAPLQQQGAQRCL